MSDIRKSRQEEEFAELVEKAKDIPILQVIGSLEQVYDSRRRPLSKEELASATYGNYLALCPFHPDENLGSFVITPSKNMWYCFTERIGTSGIHYEMRKFRDKDGNDLSFREAVLHLNYRFGNITEEEYKKWRGKKLDPGLVSRIEKKHKKETAYHPEEAHVAPENVVSVVYNLIPRICGLKEKHRTHLLRERGLRTEDLADYFTFPTRRMDLAKAIYREIAELMAHKIFGKPLKELSTEQLTWLDNDSKAMRQLKDELPYVPGFYRNGQGRIEFISYTGIGFVVRDDQKKPLGISVRKDKAQEGEKRYVWFSSGFAQGKDGCTGGASSGSPGGVIFPKKEGRDALCITEGRFKAEAIASKGKTAVYVSGVGNWQKIMPMILRLKKDRTKALVLFDADMMGNTAVHGQLASFCEALQKEAGLTPYLGVWRKENGKGFDDLVQKKGHSYKDYIHYVRFIEFEPKYQQTLRDVLAGMGLKNIKDVSTKSQRQEFNKAMQAGVEEAVFGKGEKKQ